MKTVNWACPAPSTSAADQSTAAAKSIGVSGPKPVVAGILAAFVFGSGAVYNGQYTKGFVQMLVAIVLSIGMMASFPLSLRIACLVAFVAYYVWQFVDSVRAAKMIRRKGGTTDDSKWKRPVFITALFLIFVTVNFAVQQAMLAKGVPSTDSALSSVSQTSTDSNAPSSADAQVTPEKTQADLRRDYLNGLRVDVMDTGVGWNDWSKSMIRVVEVSSETNDILYFRCDTVARGLQDEILTANGKPLSNDTCFEPKSHVIYTLKSLDGKDDWYWMNPPGDDGSDETGHPHLLVKDCPQCKPDDSQ